MNSVKTEIPVEAGDQLGIYTGSTPAGECFLYDPSGPGQYQLLGDPLIGESEGSHGFFNQTRAPIGATILPPPTVSALTPEGGYTGATTAVTITGTNLSHVKSVSFGSVNTTSFTEVSESELHAVAPTVSVAADVPVRVTTAAGESPVDPAVHFSYANPPAPSGGAGTPPPPSPAPAPVCKVPKLKGKKLKASKKAIRRAGCKVGKVTRSHGVSAAKGKVKSQKPKAGLTVAAGAKVAVKLG